MKRLLRFAAICSVWVLAQSASAADLAEQIHQAIREKKTEFVVPVGEHLLPKGLLLDGVEGFTLRGETEEKPVLKLPPVSFAISVSTPTPAGSKSIVTVRLQNIRPGMQLWIEADGDIDSFTKKPKPYFLAVVALVSAERIELTKPLTHDMPAFTMIRDADAPNLIELRNCSNIKILGLTLDGGRTENDPVIHGHAQLCGVFATGKYSYEGGPQGPLPQGLQIQDCKIRNCFGRGVAFYAVVRSSIERTTIDDCADEAVDLDHFCVDCSVTECRVTRCRIGVEMNDASRCVVRNCIVDQCGTGLSLWRWCKQPGLNEGNLISDNEFKNCSGNGLQIGTGTARNEFLSNVVRQAGRNGFSLSGEGQILKGNKISGCKLKDISVNEGTHDIQP